MSRPRYARTTDYAAAAAAAAAAYGDPALSDGSSDEQLARAISESKHTAPPPVSRAYAYASSPYSNSQYSISPTSTLIASGSQSPYTHPTNYPVYSQPPTPTPRYAADEVLARNLAREWRVNSVQSALIADPQYSHRIPDPAYVAGPPLVVRADSNTNFEYHRDSLARPLSPLLIPRPLSSNGTSFTHTPSVHSVASVASLRSVASVRSASSVRSSSSVASTSSVRSVASVSSIRSAASVSSIRSASSTASRASRAAILASVTRAARHSPLDAAARALRAALPPSHSPSASIRSSSSIRSGLSSASIKSGGSSSIRSALSSASIRFGSSTHSKSGASTPRAGSIKSSASSTHSRSGSSTHSKSGPSSDPDPAASALARLRTRATAALRCPAPGCGARIDAVPLDEIPLPSPPSSSSSLADAPPPSALLAALRARCPRPTCASKAVNESLCRGCGVPLRGWNGFGSGRGQGGMDEDETWHCPAARALGAWGAVGAFERAFDTTTNGLAKEKARDKDRPLIAPLHALAFFLAPPLPADGDGPESSPPSPPLSVFSTQSKSSRRGEGSMPGGLLLSEGEGGWGQEYAREQERMEEEHEAAEEEADAALGLLLRRSRVLGYIAGVLRAGAGSYSATGAAAAGGNGPGGIAATVDVGTWMARASAFGAVLRLLRALGNAGVGVGGCLEYPEARFPSSPSAYPSSSAHERQSGAYNNSAHPHAPQTLLTLITTLEPARAALLRLAGASTFGPTVDKAQALGDGVLYLLLQGLLAA
ncbi:hypothetical protein C8R44DRAFT_212828 [Mycena epipterygia]|nr:hypothetical protein C8R44DRAFT_212828 [Mycena epipterygia]